MLSYFLNTAYLYLFGAVGYLLFRALRLPLPALLGSLTATAALAIFNLFPAAVPIGAISMACKLALGIMVGRRIKRDSLKMIVSLASPAILLSVWMILLSVSSGMLLAFFADIPLSTALIGSTMGGVSEMAIFALAKNYDAATITVIQTFRLISALALTPWLAKKWSERLQNNGTTPQPKPSTIARHELELPLFSWREMFILVFFSVACGGVFHLLGVPAGPMLGALAASGGVCVARNKTYVFPPSITAAAQIGIGIAIAKQFGAEQIKMLTNFRFLFSVLASTGFVVAGMLLLSYCIQKMTRWSPITCLLAASPGGMTQMVAVAEEMKADTLTISILHLTRYLAIVSCMPFLIMYLLQ